MESGNLNWKCYHWYLQLRYITLHTNLLTLFNILNNLQIIVIIEKEDNLDSMQNRLKDADEKNSILLKTLNETFGKLSAIPNGKLEKYCKAWLIPALFHHFLSPKICLTFIWSMSCALWPWAAVQGTDKLEKIGLKTDTFISLYFDTVKGVPLPFVKDWFQKE